jgi:RNA polymerase sigma-70 factor (ECF subfamily)
MRERMDEDDGRLLERIRGGDGESFGVLYDRTYRWLLSRVIVPRVGPGAAPDVLSETYRTALDKVAEFEWRGVGLLHWLSSIARHKAQEHIRRTGRDGGSDAAFDDLAVLPDPAPSAEAEMIRLESSRLLSARVGEVLSALPPRYADVLRMRLLEGVPRAECAGRIGVSAATFDVVLHRATKAFQKAWDGR